MKARNTVATIFFLAAICAVLLWIVGAPVYSVVSERFFQPQSAGEAVQEFDALTAYPFADSAEPDVPQSDFQERNSPSFIQKMLDIYHRIIAVRDGVMDYTTANSEYLKEILPYKRWYDHIFGLDMTASITSGKNDLNNQGDVIAPWQEDWLGWVMDDVDVSDNVDRLIAFKEQMKAEGRNLLFLMVPSKWAQTPAFPDYSAEKYDEVIATLQENQFDLIDAEAEIQKQHLDKASMFFKTDHHWLPSSGIWADRMVCEFMNEHYGFSISTEEFAMYNYETTIVPNSLLGSMGRSVSEAYCDAEDFPIVFPKYDTDLDVFIAQTNAVTHGDMRDTLFNYLQLYSRTAYQFYGYGDQALIQVHNNKVQDGHRILVIKTSFADCMIPYLAAVVENLDVIDLRAFDGSLQTYIAQTNPDAILFVYGLVSFTETQQFDFR